MEKERGRIREGREGRREGRKEERLDRKQVEK